MATTSSQDFQLLTQAQRSAIIESWKKPFGRYAEWQKSQYDGIQYATEITIDILRLLFQQDGLGYIYEQVPFGSVQVLNNWAAVIEKVPDVVVTIGQYTHRVAELNVNGRMSPQDLNYYKPERYEMDFRLHVEGKNKMECDMLTSKLGTFLLEVILPTLAENEPSINATQQIRVSESSERRRSTNFVTHFRTISFPATLDFVPVASKDKNQIFGGLDEGTYTPI